MEPNRDHELVLQIDPKRQRFPCCIVWTPLPVISWLVPFIGHIGICREDGIILDFAGPNFVSVDNFAFGSVARYIQISPKKQCSFSAHSAAYDSGDVLAGNEEESITTWDDALRKSTQEFQHHAYNLLTCNCHSFVVNNLNRLGFQTGGWNLVNLAVLIFLKGTWVSKRSVVRTFLPFVVVCSLGIMLGGSSFLTFFLFFNPALKSNREENRSRKMGEGQVISCHTLKAWRQELEKNKNSKKLVVVDFTALWCGPCRLIEPSIAALAKKLHSVAFLKVDVDEVMYVASQWSVETLPTIVVLKEGKLVGKIIGANVNKLQETIAMNLTAT